MSGEPGCNCGNAALWLVEAALLETNPSVLARKLLASQNQYTIDDDPFIKIELLLASHLATAVGAKGAQAEQVLRDALTLPIDPDEVTKAIKQIGILLNEPIDDTTLTNIRIYINDLITKGAQDANAADVTPADDSSDDSQDDNEPDNTGAPQPDTTPLTETSAVMAALLTTSLLAKGGSKEILPEISKVFENMVESIKYFANHQISDVILPSVNDAVEEWLKSYLGGDYQDETDSNGIPSLTTLLDWVNGKLDMDAYWRTTANVSASRAYHYGLFKAAEDLGVTSFIVVNPLDERTSEICQYLFGMQFDILNAVDNAEKIANAPVDQLGDISPFLDPMDIIGKSPEELMAMGVTTPPYHMSCRSWAELVDSSSDTTG